MVSSIFKVTDEQVISLYFMISGGDIVGLGKYTKEAVPHYAKKVMPNLCCDNSVGTSSSGPVASGPLWGYLTSLILNGIFCALVTGLSLTIITCLSWLLFNGTNGS